MPRVLHTLLLDQGVAARRRLIGAHAAAPVQRSDTSFAADLANQAACQPGMQHFEFELFLLGRLLGIPHRVELMLDRAAFRQQVGGDVFRGVIVAVRTSPVNEANAARPHHVEEQLLLFNRVTAPDQQLQQRAGEASAQAFQLAPALVAVEHRVDRIQRPALVEHDAVLEQTLPVEHNPGVVQEAQQFAW